jgi:hypothetical protein
MPFSCIGAAACEATAGFCAKTPNGVTIAQKTATWLMEENFIKCVELYCPAIPTGAGDMPKSRPEIKTPEKAF